MPVRLLSFYKGGYTGFHVCAAEGAHELRLLESLQMPQTCSLRARIMTRTSDGFYSPFAIPSLQVRSFPPRVTAVRVSHSGAIRIRSCKRGMTQIISRKQFLSSSTLSLEAAARELLSAGNRMGTQPIKGSGNPHPYIEMRRRDNLAENKHMCTYNLGHLTVTTVSTGI